MMYLDGRRTLFAIAMCALASACADAPVGTDQAALISDHAHNGGMPGFYFLAPLVPPPFATGVFEPRLAPEVRIDQVHPTTGATLATVVHFNSHTRVGGAKVRRNVRRGHYVVRWRTDDYNLSPTSTYRIRVLVEGRELGFADVDVVRTRNEFRHVDRSEFVPLKQNSTLAIKFRIETRTVDRDGDGVMDWRDNCPDVANGPGGPGAPGWPHLPPWGCDPDGDECDPDEGDCGAPPAGGQLDSDGDGVGDACECTAVTCAPADACHGAGTCQPATGACTAPALPDGDGDGACDAIDGCPEDPDKTTPGVCGCGVTDTDSDGDGTADCTDTCPLDPTKVAAGACGCGVADTDGDGDGTPDCQDACALDPSKVAAGTCGCGVADTDTDGDGAVDCTDACPLDPTKVAAGACGCGVVDQPGCGVCTDDADPDGDGVGNCLDACSLDPWKTAPGTCGCGLEDMDGDVDGIIDCVDPCPGDQANTCPRECRIDLFNAGIVPVGEAIDVQIDLLNYQVLEVSAEGGLVLQAAGEAPFDARLDVFAFGPAGAAQPTVSFAAQSDTSVLLQVTPYAAGTYQANVELSSATMATACIGSPLTFTAVCAGFTDADGDGVGDCDDGCPLDAGQTTPGACGCGVAETDADGSLIPDCLE